MLTRFTRAATRDAHRIVGSLALSLVTAGGLLAATLPAYAQMSRGAAVGLYRAATQTFVLDGNFDGAADLVHVFGRPGDIPLLGDLKGSGSPAPVVYRSGLWQFDFDRDGLPDQEVTFGTASDTPLMADIDGDGKDDLVLYRGGRWLVNTRADGTTQHTLQFGGGRGDIPLLGDVNGDGAVDLIIYNRGSWHVSLSQGNAIHASYSFGDGGGEIPMVFDYDGNGVADLVTFDAGVWKARSTSGQTGSFNYGTSGDRPLYYGRGALPNTTLDIHRFLNQATFGATASDMARVRSIGYAAFVDEQLGAPHTELAYMPWWPQNRPQDSANPYCQYFHYAFGVSYSPDAPCNCNAEPGTFNQCQRDVYSNFNLQRELFKRAMTAPDQLRHRVAWALSQILVTSNLQDAIAYPMRNYQQLLLSSAFGRFEDLLYQITLSPWMGNYLDMVRNNGSPAAQAAGVVPNENYARELLQLFSIGLWELNADGSPVLDAQGNPVPTYDQDDIVQLSRALTGWSYPPLPGQSPRFNAGVNYVGIMQPIEGPLNGTGSTNYHDTGAKSVMASAQPAGTRAEPDVRWAVQIAANHPNTGVYIGRQLIQQLVTSNPSPAYVARITSVWNNNGSGVRGDLRAVVRAILLDPEARSPRNPVGTVRGKLKEPVLVMTNFLRAIDGWTDGAYLRSPASSMGQNIYNAPTVFNYYQQDFVIPGTTLSGPPFQIFDATSYFARANFFYNLIYSTSCDTGSAISPSVCGPNPDNTIYQATGTKIPWQPIKTVAPDAPGMVDMLSDRLLGTRLPPAQRSKVIAAVNALPRSTPFTNNQLIDRARMAVYLIAVSPQFQVEY